MFELKSLTKVRVLDVRTLASKDRKPDDPAGAQLLLQGTMTSDVLAMFDGFLPGMLYRKANEAAKQGALEGLEPTELTPIGDHVKRMPWVYEQTGCSMVIDHGTGGKSNITLSDCKVHRVSFKPEQKGVVVQWSVDALALNDATRGKLTGLKATDIQMTLAGPDVGSNPQQSIDDSKDPAPEKVKEPAGGKVADTPGDTPGFPPSGKGVSTEKPPQSATTEHVPEKPRRGGRRVVTAME
jgi:hypothetical protein